MPYWRLSGFYFFYFASLGALVPYWGLYLKSTGFSANDIGIFMAVIMGTKIVSPNIWGWLADHMGKRMVIVRLGCLLAAITFAGVFVSDNYWWLLLVMVAFSFFWNAALPQFEATTFNYLGDYTHRYSSIRLWGSIGFIVAVAGIGSVLDLLGASILPIVLVVLFSAIWLTSLLVSEQSARHLPVTHEPLMDILRRREVLALLAVCFLMQMSHGPYYTFYSIYLEEHDYSSLLIGQLWALGVIAEVVLFLLMHYLVPRFGLRALLLSSLLLAALRWIMIGYFVDVLWLLVFAQLFHAASFGIYHASAIELIHRCFTGRHQGKGQALYSSLSFGAGGAVGSLYSGLIWDGLGATTTFVVAALVALLAFVISWIWIKPDAMRPV
ncbi:MAG: MFS transporter [Gammaproteobacteria bacterium]|jgi:PPP family 3-phenylpropionic acid transporter